MLGTETIRRTKKTQPGTQVSSLRFSIIFFDSQFTRYYMFTNAHDVRSKLLPAEHIVVETHGDVSHQSTKWGDRIRLHSHKKTMKVAAMHAMAPPTLIPHSKLNNTLEYE